MFKVRGSIDTVFELTEEFFSEKTFRLENSRKPELLVLSRGNIRGSLFEFDIQKLKTELTISLQQGDGEVQVQCVYETRYGRLITSREKTVFENDISKLKQFLAAAEQK